MANTTKDEAPATKPVSVKTNQEDEIKALYQQGKNLYQIARTVFEFESDEAVERIRRVLGIMEPPESRIMDE